MYPVLELFEPPIPSTVSEREFNETIAHPLERGHWSYHCWLGTREVVGDIMEYQFRRQFSIPVHFPRAVMKTIFLFLAEEDSDEPFGGPGWLMTPIEINTFRWPRPFRYP